jgi:hypothetical protein
LPLPVDTKPPVIPQMPTGVANKSGSVHSASETPKGTGKKNKRNASKGAAQPKAPKQRKTKADKQKEAAMAAASQAQAQAQAQVQPPIIPPMPTVPSQQTRQDIDPYKLWADNNANMESLTQRPMQAPPQLSAPPQLGIYFQQVF